MENFQVYKQIFAQISLSFFFWFSVAEALISWWQLGFWFDFHVFFVIDRQSTHWISNNAFLFYLRYMSTSGRLYWIVCSCLVLKFTVQKQVLLKILQNTCAIVSFFMKLRACNFIKNGTLAQVFYSGFYEIFKNGFFTEHLRVTASGNNGKTINKKDLLTRIINEKY